jgi:Flp pilus assembly protein TadB
VIAGAIGGGFGLDVFIGQTLVGGAGLFILWLRWREARRLQMEAQDLNLPA